MNLRAEVAKLSTPVRIAPIYCKDPGETRIQSLQSVLINGPVYMDGTYISTTSARLILGTYFTLSRGQQERFRNVTAGRMLLIAQQARGTTAGFQTLLVTI